MKDRRPRPFVIVIAGLFALAGAALGVLYLFPTLQIADRQLAMVSSFIPYGLILWLLAVLVLLLFGRGIGRWLTLVPFAGLLAYSLVLVPYFDVSYSAPATTPATVRVMMLNMHYGQADPEELFAQVEKARPDVVVLTEFTTQAEPLLTDARWTALLPYHLGTTGRRSYNRLDGDSSGTQVLSRTAITELARTQGTTATNIAVKVETGGHTFVLLAAHPVNPVRGDTDGWMADADAVTQLASQFGGQPLVLAGDLNSVPEHVTLRNLVAATGLHEATQGWQPTYPADRMVPLITIDHLFASAQFMTVSVQRFDVANTDHLGSIVELAQS